MRHHAQGRTGGPAPPLRLRRRPRPTEGRGPSIARLRVRCAEHPQGTHQEKPSAIEASACCDKCQVGVECFERRHTTHDFLETSVRVPKFERACRHPVTSFATMHRPRSAEANPAARMMRSALPTPKSCPSSTPRSAWPPPPPPHRRGLSPPPRAQRRPHTVCEPQRAPSATFAVGLLGEPFGDEPMTWPAATLSTLVAAGLLNEVMICMGFAAFRCSWTRRCKRGRRLKQWRRRAYPPTPARR